MQYERDRLRLRIFFGGTSSHVVEFLHPSPVQSSRSLQHMLTVQLYLNKRVCFTCAVNLDEVPLYIVYFTDQAQEENFGGTSSLVGQFLHPSPVQSSRSIQCMQTVQLFLNKCGFYLCWQFGWGTSLCFTDQAQEEMFGHNQLPCGTVLAHISCTKLKIPLTQADSPIVPKQMYLFYLCC